MQRMDVIYKKAGISFFLNDFLSDKLPLVQALLVRLESQEIPCHPNNAKQKYVNCVKVFYTAFKTREPR